MTQQIAPFEIEDIEILSGEATLVYGKKYDELPLTPFSMLCAENFSAKFFALPMKTWKESASVTTCDMLHGQICSEYN